MSKIHVAHILVNHKHEAEDILKKLEAGETFENLAKKFSTCPSSKQGGELGEVATSRLDETFLEAAEALKVGEVSGVVRTRFGHHLIKRF